MPKQAKTGPSKANTLEELYRFIAEKGQESSYEPDTYLPPYIIREYIDDEGTIHHIFEKVYKILKLKRRFGHTLPTTKARSSPAPSPAPLPTPSPPSPPSTPAQGLTEEEKAPPLQKGQGVRTSEEPLPKEPTLPEEAPREGQGEEEPSETQPGKVGEGVEEASHEGEAEEVEERAKPVTDFSTNPLKEYEMFKSSPPTQPSAEREKGPEEEGEKALKPLPGKGDGGDEDMEMVIPYIDKHKPVELECPYYLNLPLEEEVEKLLRKAQEEVESEGKADKDEIRKRIYELTRQLLTSKDAKEKEAIRKEIRELKGMLSVISKGGKPTALSFLEELILPELSKRIEEFLGQVKAYRESIENGYHQAKALAKGDSALEEKVEALYREDSNALQQQALACGAKVKDYLASLYLTAIDRAEGKEEEKEALREKVEEKLKLFEGELKRLFGMAREEAPKEEEAPKSAFEEYERAIKEVESLKETELLHFLHSHDRKAFMAYIRGEVDKEKALLYAKRLYAIKVKKVPEHIVNRYYEEVEL